MTRFKTILAVRFPNWRQSYDTEQHWKKCAACETVDESGKADHSWVLNGETSTETENHYDCECGAKKTERVEPGLDKAPIDKAIVEAEAAKAGIVVNDGNPSDVPSGTKFVSAVVMKALDNAIQAAKDAKETVMTEQDVTDTVKALTDAAAVFTKAIQTGSYVPSYTPTSNTTTKTEKNEDGSTTKTVTNKTTGTVTETTTWPNGDKAVVVTKKDGTVTTTASRELLGGTGKERFSPMMDMSRAMLVTVLARLNGVDTAGGETWYSKAMDWGIKNGITDGTNVDASITRESLVVMLYRYAKAEKVDGMALSEFPDSGSVSGWADAAMDWAIKTGIINGKSGNTLDPQGTATRAEVAAMLQRFISQ